MSTEAASQPTAAIVTTQVVLVRHGETQWNLDHRYQGTTDIPLNETGLKQAAEVAQAIGGAGWDVIIASPLSRAMQTAQAVAEIAEIAEVLPDPDLKERSYGEAEGLTLAEREAVWPGGNWPGLEDWDNVAKRGLRAINRAVEDYPGQRILMVAHGGLINSILAVLSHNEIGSGKTVIVNTSRTYLTHDANGWTIGDVNVHDHVSYYTKPGD